MRSAASAVASILGSSGHGAVVLGARAVEVREEDPDDRRRGARAGVEGDAPDLGERDAGDEEDAPHAVVRGDPDAPDDPDPGNPRRLDGRDDAGLDLAPGEPVRAGRRDVGDREEPLDRAP